MGTISGGSAQILGSPSTRWVSFSKARMLFFARAFARFFSPVLAVLRLAPVWNSAIIESMSRWAYHTSRLRISANSRHRLAVASGPT